MVTDFPIIEMNILFIQNVCLVEKQIEQHQNIKSLTRADFS